MSFNSALADPKQLGHVTVNTADSLGASGGFFARAKSKGRVLPLDSPTMHHVLVTEANEDVRRQASRQEVQYNFIWVQKCISLDPLTGTLFVLFSFSGVPCW